MSDGASGLASDVVVGSMAALRAPHVINASLRSMIDAPIADASTPSDSARAIRIAMRTLQVLSRVPGAYWRNTCLYQSVAECAVRRARGWPARVVIGVGKEQSDVIAHAWVEIAGMAPSAIPMTSLRPASQQSAE
jgi:hypothetical protein